MRSDIFHGNAHILPNNISYTPFFNEFGAVCGGVSDITPELAIKLGHAAAKIGKRIAIGYSNHTICKLLANAFIAGAGSAGAQTTEIDAGFFAVASFIARSYLFNLTVFIENDSGRLRIRIIDKFGLSIDRDTQRKIEIYASNDDSYIAGISDVVMPKNISGAKEAFSLSVAKRGAISDFPVSVSGNSLACETLRNVLEMSGCEIAETTSGILALSVSDDGMQLRITDEDENWYDDGHAEALLCLIYFLSGESELAVSATAPAVLERIADRFGGRIMRIGRDSAAKEIFLTQKVLCDAISSAVFLCEHLCSCNQSVCELVSEIPEFTLVSQEVALSRDRLAVLSELALENDGLHKEDIGALRVCTDGGWVNISPSRSKTSLRITGEGMNEEIASELCNLFVEKTKFIDKNSKNHPTGQIH